MFKYIIKIAYPYLLLIPILVLFAYSVQQDFFNFYFEMLCTVVLSYSLYFGILAVLGLTLRTRIQAINKAIFVFASTLIYVFTSSVIISNYVGKVNWGTPINYKLYFEIFSSFNSSIQTLFQSSTSYLPIVAALSSIIGLIVFHIYNYNIFEDFSKYLVTKKPKSIVLFLILAILSVTFCVSSSSTELTAIKNEIFVSFCSDLDPLAETNSMKIGLKDLNLEVSKIEKFDRKNVIIFSVDCLRSDHLSYLGYHRETSPFIDSLYHAGKIADFEVMTSTASNSFYGILSTLNSKNVGSLGYFKYGLQDYLKLQGYTNNFIVSGAHKNFYNLKKHYGSNIDYYVEGGSLKGFTNQDDLFLLEAFKKIKPYVVGEPNFFFFHLMGPHLIGKSHEQFQKFKPIVKDWAMRKKISGGQDYAKLYTNHYDNGIYQSDNIIKLLYESLERKGYLDNSIIVVLGDHGEELGERSFFGHGKSLNKSSIGIPILFIDNEAHKYKEHNYATQIDVAPTIASRLGLPIPSQWQGKNLMVNHPERITFHEQVPSGYLNPILSVLHKQDSVIFKYVLNANSRTEEFYNVSIDSNQTNSLVNDSIDLSFYKQQIIEYKRNHIENYENNSSSIDNIETTSKSKMEERCEFADKLFVRKLLNIESDDIYKGCKVNLAQKSCNCSFVWSDNFNNYFDLSLRVVNTKNVRRKLNNSKKRNFISGKDVIAENDVSMRKWVKRTNCHLNLEKQKVNLVSSDNFMISISLNGPKYTDQELIEIAKAIEKKYIESN